MCIPPSPTHHTLGGSRFPRRPLPTTTKPTPKHIPGRQGRGRKKTSPTGRRDFNTIYIISYIYFSLYLLTSVTHLKCHRDQNRAAFWWNSWQSHTRYKTRGLCPLIHHTVHFSSIFYVQRATLLGRKLKKKKVTHPRKEGWSGWAHVAGPLTPRGPLAPCPQVLPPCPPRTVLASKCRGRPRPGGRESAAHFGLEGESQIGESKRGEWGPRSSSDSLLPPAASLGSLVPSRPGPPDRAQEPGSRPLRSGLRDPGGLAGSQGLAAAWEDDRGGIPHRAPGTLHSRNERKGRDPTVKSGAPGSGPPHPTTFSRLVRPKPSAIWVPNDRMLRL